MSPGPGLLSGWGRWLRVTAYGLQVMAGAVLAPQVDLIPGILEWLWLLMCTWLVVGGWLCLIGQLTRRWVGEFVGLPLGAAALLGFAVLQGQVSGWALIAVPSVALLGAYGLMLVSRWRDVSALYRVARRGTP